MFGPSLELTSHHLDRIVDVAAHGKERRFRLEALNLLWEVSKEGTSPQKKRADDVLNTAKKDPDPFVATDARYLATAKWDKKLLTESMQSR